MTSTLLEALGIYGASFCVAFIAGLFPPFSIEVFLIGLTAVIGPTFATLTLCCLIAAIGHQISKTLCYYAGVGMLERGKLGAKLDKVRPKIDKWNKAPHLVMFISGAIGFPPLYVLAFIAEPIMRMRIVPFTAIVFVSRFGRFVALAVIPLLFRA
jgi:membrane protein YqaA with SNARE-associated domain